MKALRSALCQFLLVSNLGLILLGGTLPTPGQAQVGMPVQTPFSGESEPGVEFPLPQEINPVNGRRLNISNSNSLALSWDSSIVMYLDTGTALWSGKPSESNSRGYVYCMFDKSKIVVDSSGRPQFPAACFGTPLARFATVKTGTNPAGYPGNNYPGYSGYTGGPYPDIAGTMGELGLLTPESLSNIMYPVPASELPSDAHLANPYRSDATGTPDANGNFKTYLTYTTFQDKPKFFDGTNWVGLHSGNMTRYQPGTYPNLESRTTVGSEIKRNGRAKIEIVVDPVNQIVVDVEVKEKWQPFRVRKSIGWGTQTGLTVGISVPSDTEMWADNFEPSLTLDGHLMIGKGQPRLVNAGSGGARVNFYYNQTPFGTTDWQGPWELHHLYRLRSTDVAGHKLSERYPLARHPIKDYDGSVLGDLNNDDDFTDADLTFGERPFEGGYNWISHDGRFVIFSCKSGGVGSDHPRTLNKFNDGGGSSNRAQVSIVGSVTGWQLWRVDHAALNPSRHMFTAWDQDSRTTFQRTGSFGFSPGFWDLLRGANGLPMLKKDTTKLQLVHSARLLYYEVDLSPFLERDHAFFFPMTEMLDIDENYTSVHNMRRKVDIDRTPDLSGNGHVGWVEGGELPVEYFELPEQINTDPTDPGLYTGAVNPSDIHPAWTAADTIVDASNLHWAPLADWEDGKDITGDGVIDTQPYENRGVKHDMDSDMCWGKVGQAMFFREETQVRVKNTGTPPELNPGTSIQGASDRLTASLWVHPLQDRDGAAELLLHNLKIELRPGAVSGGKQQGQIAVAVQEPGGVLHWLLSDDDVAPRETWTHVAMTWQDTEGSNSSSLRLFVNGLEVPNSPLSLTFDNLKLNSQDILLGCLNDCATTTGAAVLLLDEVFLKNSAMLDDEVRLAAFLPPPTETWDNTGLPVSPPLPYDNDTDGRVPVSNPYDDNVARLGADLFHDVQLSLDKTISCATCHVAELAFTDGQTTATGLGGVSLPRNTPTIYNSRFRTRQFWDARSVDLEDQALDPVFHPQEMGLNWATVKAYLEGDNDYLARFNLYMGTNGNITETDARQALATFMRAPTAGASRADSFEIGAASLTDPELRGRSLFFGRARCIGCHNGPDFSDGRLWSTGTFHTDDSDNGAFEETAAPGTASRAKFFGAFKTPTLRELTRTGPYFHDGHGTTLTEVVEFYNQGGVRQDANGFGLLDPIHDIVAEETNRKLGLSPSEVSDLVAYLQALTGTQIDDGPSGFNAQPTVVIQLSNGGPPSPMASMFGVVVRVTDPDGRADLNRFMAWTLEVVIDGTPHDWTTGTVSNIANGFKVSFVALNPNNVSAQAADRHGLWSDLVTN